MNQDKTTSTTTRDTDVVDRIIGTDHAKCTIEMPDGQTFVGTGRTEEIAERHASESYHNSQERK